MKKFLRRDIFLEDLANSILHRVGYKGPRIYFYWNNRFRTTAGILIREGRKRIELNPVLEEGKFRKYLMCTLKHELAHVLAYYRAGRRQIEMHGLEWQQACRDLGIPNEKRCHDLEFRNINVRRKFFYCCPVCANLIGRVRPFERPHACIDCCKKYNRKIKYDERFRMRLLSNRSRI